MANPDYINTLILRLESILGDKEAVYDCLGYTGQHILRALKAPDQYSDMLTIIEYRATDYIDEYEKRKTNVALEAFLKGYGTEYFDDEDVAEGPEKKLRRIEMILGLCANRIQELTKQNDDLVEENKEQTNQIKALTELARVLSLLIPTNGITPEKETLVTQLQQTLQHLINSFTKKEPTIQDLEVPRLKTRRTKKTPPDSEQPNPSVD